MVPGSETRQGIPNDATGGLVEDVETPWHAALVMRVENGLVPSEKDLSNTVEGENKIVPQLS